MMVSTNTSSRIRNGSETTRPRPGKRTLPPPLKIERIVRPTIKIVNNAATIANRINIKRIFALYKKARNWKVSRFLPFAIQPTTKLNEDAVIFIIFDFYIAFSPDGWQLALSRETFNSDVVLIENAK